MTSIRDATTADLDAIVAVYNDAILTSKAIWTDEPVEKPDRETWLAQRQDAGHPVLVAVEDDAVVGYGSYGPWQSKWGYRFTVENSIYLAEEYRGRGIGALLLDELLGRARNAGMHVMVADIEASNTSSIRLHERFGFTRAGVVHQVGTKFGQWLDLAILERTLDEP